MKAEFKNSFAKDLAKIKDKRVLLQVRAVIREIEEADDLHGVKNLRKLSGGRQFYRIRTGDYRVGLIIEQDTVFFVRVLNRRDIYRYFP